MVASSSRARAPSRRILDLGVVLARSRQPISHREHRGKSRGDAVSARRLLQVVSEHAIDD